MAAAKEPAGGRRRGGDGLGTRARPPGARSRPKRSSSRRRRGARWPSAWAATRRGCCARCWRLEAAPRPRPGVPPMADGGAARRAPPCARRRTPTSSGQRAVAGHPPHRVSADPRRRYGGAGLRLDHRHWWILSRRPDAVALMHFANGPTAQAYVVVEANSTCAQPVRQWVSAGDDIVYSGTSRFSGISHTQRRARPSAIEVIQFWMGPRRRGVHYAIGCDAEEEVDLLAVVEGPGSWDAAQPLADRGRAARRARPVLRLAPRRHPRWVAAAAPASAGGCSSCSPFCTGTAGAWCCSATLARDAAPPRAGGEHDRRGRLHARGPARAGATGDLEPVLASYQRLRRARTRQIAASWWTPTRCCTCATTTPTSRGATRRCAASPTTSAGSTSSTARGRPRCARRWAQPVHRLQKQLDVAMAASATASSGNVESTNGRAPAVSTNFQNASWSCSLALLNLPAVPSACRASAQVDLDDAAELGARGDDPRPAARGRPRRAGRAAVPRGCGSRRPTPRPPVRSWSRSRASGAVESTTAVYIGSVARRAARSAPRAVPNTTLPKRLGRRRGLLPDDEPS